MTGSAGFIGGYVVQELLDRGHEVVGVDNYSKYGPVSRSYDTHPRYRFVFGDARDTAHDGLHLIRFLLEGFEITAKELDRQLALHAADGFFDVVGNRLREIPIDSGELLKLLVHGGDQFVFLAMEFRAPLLARQKINEEFGVVETAGVAAVVGAADLTDNQPDLRETREHDASIPCHGDARGRPSAGRESAAHPDGALIEVRKKFGADDSAQGEEEHQA